MRNSLHRLCPATFLQQEWRSEELKTALGWRVKVSIMAGLILKDKSTGSPRRGFLMYSLQ